jgi:hypothetical protein
MNAFIQKLKNADVATAHKTVAPAHKTSDDKRAKPKQTQYNIKATQSIMYKEGMQSTPGIAPAHLKEICKCV